MNVTLDDWAETDYNTYWLSEEDNKYIREKRKLNKARDAYLDREYARYYTLSARGIKEKRDLEDKLPNRMRKANMKVVKSIKEAKEFFLANSSGSVLCEMNGKGQEVDCFPDASIFFDKNRKIVRFVFEHDWLDSYRVFDSLELAEHFEYGFNTAEEFASDGIALLTFDELLFDSWCESKFKLFIERLEQLKEKSLESDERKEEYQKWCAIINDQLNIDVSQGDQEFLDRYANIVNQINEHLGEYKL